MISSIANIIDDNIHEEAPGFIDGVTPVNDEQLRDRPGKYTYHTDGLRAVLFITNRTVSLSDIKFLDWALPLE
jgi:hypothetical protein